MAQKIMTEFSRHIHSLPDHFINLLKGIHIAFQNFFLLLLLTRFLKSDSQVRLPEKIPAKLPVFPSFVRPHLFLLLCVRESHTAQNGSQHKDSDFVLYLTGFLFPADPQNRLCKDHNTLFQAFDFYKLICPVHAIVNFKVCTAETQHRFSGDGHTFRRRLQMAFPGLPVTSV